MKYTFPLLLLALLLSACAKKETRETKFSNGQVKETFDVREVNGSFLKDGLYTTIMKTARSARRLSTVKTKSTAQPANGQTKEC